jgi:hypothetical protein
MAGKTADIRGGSLMNHEGRFAAVVLLVVENVWT